MYLGDTTDPEVEIVWIQQRIATYAKGQAKRREKGSLLAMARRIEAEKGRQEAPP